MFSNDHQIINSSSTCIGPNVCFPSIECSGQGSSTLNSLETVVNHIPTSAPSIFVSQLYSVITTVKPTNFANLVQPSLAMPQAKLIDNPRENWNNWRSHNATRLRLEWAPYNLTNDINAMVDIKLMGYWEVGEAEFQRKICWEIVRSGTFSGHGRSHF